EFTGSSADVVLSVPMPDGSLARFKIEESPIMDPALAARFPNIKTYRGQGVDDKSATARFGVTPEGFHAIILKSGGTVLIDPYAKGDTTNYITYLKRDVPKTNRFECLVQDLDPAVNPMLKPLSGVNTKSSSMAGDEVTPNLVGPSGSVLRTYMLALAATAEYVNVFRQPGDTDQQAKERALVQMIIIMNRVNGVYERDLAIHMTLIARELDIIYTDPLMDPYTNDAGPSMITENQTNLDLVIGSPNYDIGHVFSTGGGGVATLRVPCKNGSKARGVTGLPNPTGDVFAIDYVAHEMGHQFGGNHTFNGMAESCGTPGQRSAAASVEPGSGSTIQAYAGICSTQDLQKNSDDYFHVKSLEELSFYTTGTGSGHEGNTCDDETGTGNTVPGVDAGANYTIPKDTPFMLTAAAFDADGDPLTYAWEEYDAGGTVGFSPPDNDIDGTARPILRSYDPVASPSRVFPSLQYILNNANVPPTFYNCGLTIAGQNVPCLTGEILPAANRVMNFQVTVRDNRASGGGVISDLTQVTVVRNSGATIFGPFAVTAPNTAVTWAGQSTQTVTWDVANTTAAPINAANVKISLSADGGNTFPFVLTANTPNDGSELITVPNVATTTARIKVEAVGNIFFDISSANFTVTSINCVANLALATGGAVATASSTYANSGFPPSSTIDGEHRGLNWGNNGGWNDNTRGVYPDSLEVSFSASGSVSRTIGEIRVYTVQNDFNNPVEPDENTPADVYGILDFDVEYWDGSGWVTVPDGSVTGNDKAMRVFTFPDITTTRIRVVIHNSRNNWSRITEVEAFGCP
ncbi:MAG TPA: zinc-dependent metalloprotease family protein, partial [Pyrinomonadaceae bacterium]|nr:zinc-dependent metalloprotease family protein [Pyrinomonadaceae bacterium]